MSPTVCCVSFMPPFSDSRLSRPHLPLAGPPAAAVSAQSCLLAEITAAICARKHDRLFNAESRCPPGPRRSFRGVVAWRACPRRRSMTRFRLASTIASRSISSPLPWPLSVNCAARSASSSCCWEIPLSMQSFRHCLRACAECRLPVLFYFETGLHLSAAQTCSPRPARPALRLCRNRRAPDYHRRSRPGRSLSGDYRSR